MRSRVSAFVLAGVVFLVVFTTWCWGAQVQIVPPVESEVEKVLHLGILIHIPDKEHPVWFYKQVCEEEVVPQFLAELDEKGLAERIVVQMNQPTETIWVYIKDGYPSLSKYGRKLAEMALRKFSALDQAKRIREITPISKEKKEVEAGLKASQERARAFEQHAARAKSEIDWLKAQLGSQKGELMQAGLKKAELETKLKLLAQKAEQVKGTVSAEEIAVLEKTAKELEMQIEEQSSEDTVAKLALILRQKEQDLKRVMELRERAVISAAEVDKAQFECEMAKRDYERARRLTDELRNRLERVKAELAKAKEEFAETGGLALATIIAEKTLECETELASVQGKMRNLAESIAGVKADIDDGRNLEHQVESERVRSQELSAKLETLRAQEEELDRRIRAGVKVNKSPEGWYKTGGYSDIGQERPGQFEVVGEVKKPGSMKLQPETTVMKGIEAAGGFTEQADTENVVILRAAKAPPRPKVEQWDVTRHVVDCKAILDGKAPDDFIIEPDDTVIVPRKESAD